MKQYSEIDILFKDFQTKINKKETFEEGKKILLTLRDKLMNLQKPSYERAIWDLLLKVDFSAMPLKNHKTIAYYLYHLTRIEDITSNLLIDDSPQIFFTQGYHTSLNSQITTTGNELTYAQIIAFSKQLNLEELKKYRQEVFQKTNKIIMSLTYNEGKTKVKAENIAKIRQQNSLSEDKEAIWLLSYWGSKTYIGLLLMPFSRHQMLHLEACKRIAEKLLKDTK